MKLPQRLVLTFTHEGVEARVLYRTKDAPNPGTKARKDEALQLTKAGLTEALGVLEAGEVESGGEAGFETREDTLVCDTPKHPQYAKTSTKGERHGQG